MYCPVHYENSIISICIAPHKCENQRKLCVECQYEHRIDIKHSVPIKLFQEKMIKKLKESKLESELIKQKEDFKSIISQTESMLRKIIYELSESIKQIFDMIELINNSYTNLINENTNLAELSYYDIEKLIQWFQGNSLYDCDKNYYMIKLEKVKNQWGQVVRSIVQQIQESMKEILSNEKNQEKKERLQIIKMERYQQKEFTQELKAIYWDYSSNQPLKLKKTLQITFTQNKEIYYFKDGSRLRIDQITDNTRKPEILTNLEQIQHLQWSGNYGENNQKIGKWIAKWKGEIIQGVGGQYSNGGKKQGNWRDMIKNYWTLAQVFEEGQYVRDQRNGMWKYIYENNEIGGGDYNKGLRNGKWLELSEGFWQFSQLIQNGEYKNGKKIGRWDICFKDPNSNDKNKKIGEGSFHQIGGGSYAEAGDGLKQGSWVEIPDNFTDSTQVTYNGEYKNGKKIGRWDIFYRKHSSDPFFQMQKYHKQFQQIHIMENVISGGGSYAEAGDGLKQGNWVEIPVNFTDSTQVTYNGEYKNGKKIGRWDIFYRKHSIDQFFKIFNKFILWKMQISGGGSYAEAGNGLKQGNWMEISDNFSDYSQIAYNGGYINGKKVGRWDIQYLKDLKESFQIIGGGSYNEDDEAKIASKTYFATGLIGMNHGCKQYDIKCDSDDEVDDYVKLGKWIEAHDEYNDSYQITYQGEYTKNKKVGRWDSYFQGNLIGGGSYTENGIKNGKWVLLSDNFFLYNLITYIGQFQDGEKVGQWDIMKLQILKDGNLIFSKIGQKIYKKIN